MITLVDSGGANKNSISHLFQRLDLKYQWSQDPNVISHAPFVILPGVGHAQKIMTTLKEKNIDHALKERSAPTLGICIGMQILFENLEEGNCEGLGILPGTVTKIKVKPPFPVPHMGWNRVRFSQQNSTFPFPSNYFYFVHSYEAPNGQWVQAHCEYAHKTLPAMVHKNQFFGVQFHPEKSGSAGEEFMTNFIRTYL